MALALAAARGGINRQQISALSGPGLIGQLDKQGFLFFETGRLWCRFRLFEVFFFFRLGLGLGLGFRLRRFFLGSAGGFGLLFSLYWGSLLYGLLLQAGRPGGCSFLLAAIRPPVLDGLVSLLLCPGFAAPDRNCSRNAASGPPGTAIIMMKKLFIKEFTQRILAALQMVWSSVQHARMVVVQTE